MQYRFKLLSQVVMLGLWTASACGQPAQVESRAGQVGLAGLREVAAELVESQRVVGLELLVQLEGETVLHQAWGWEDREAGKKLAVDRIYNIRSMTKPMAATAAHVLMERGQLRLSDRVSDYLPAFDNDKCREITLEELLLHRAGYEQGSPGGRRRSSFSGLQELAEEYGRLGPSLPRDGAWSYADAHSDILGAVVEKVTGKAADQVLREEVIDPLKMSSTLTRIQAGDPRLKRVPPLYRGSTSNWRKVWQPEDGPIFAYPLYAQSVFASARDYARFLRMWMNNGELDGVRILAPGSVKLAFSNRQPLPLPPGFFPLAEERQAAYGHFWGMVFEGGSAPDDLPLAFMHQGSDGTAAYAFPKLDLIVIAMTQSRGTDALSAIETAVRDELAEPLLEYSGGL